MATSGSITKDFTLFDSITFRWETVSQSVEYNTSTVAWTLTLTATAYGDIDSTAPKSWSVTVNGTKYSGTNYIGISAKKSKTLASGTTVIKHNDDGSKTFSYSFTQEVDIVFGGSTINNVSGSSTGTLNTIPRSSSLSASNGTLGTVQTLTISRKDSSFKHKITYVCGDVSGYAAGSSTGFTTATSVSWTPPLSLAEQNTSGTSVSITLYLKTYDSSGNQIGSNYTKTITCNIPASVKPSCSLSVTDATEYTTMFGNPVQGLSKFKIVVTPTIAYNSPITSYNTTANGVKYTAASFTTGVLRSSGTQTISSTVVDKRGRNGTASVSKTVLAYTQPVIIKLTVKRCDENGTENDKGEYILATFSATVTDLNNKNTASYVLRYKKTAETEYTEVGLDEYENVFSVTDATYIFPADSGNSYNVELIVSDKFKTTTRATSASTGFTLMHWKADGTGLAIGKISEESNLFDVGLPACFRDAVSGNVLGLNKLPEIPANSDFNDYMETGSYAVYKNANAETISNMPIQKAGRLEVSAATGEGIRVSEWSYLRQRFIPYSLNYSVYERDITRSDSNIWSYGEWIPTSLKNGKILWNGDVEGAKYMTAGHTITLSEAVSAQPSGIVLTFCKYSDGEAQDNNFNHFFVPKTFVDNNAGYGSAFTMMDINFGQICHKYLYISNTAITGHANNSASGTGASGITYDNSKYVLRYVAGV